MGKARRKERDRPAPIVGIEAAHDRVSVALSRRSDRFSQLLSRAARDERHGDVLMTTPGLTRQEHEELARLRPAAHEELGVELGAAIARLRGLLNAGDPFFIVSVVQDANLFVPWGEYYEPTHEGLESRVELVAGLLATQPVAATRDRPTAEAVQAILDEIDHVLLVNFLFNLTKPPSGDATVASLRFANTMRWMSIRGSSSAGHGEDLARELYGSQDVWMAESFGFTIVDVIKVGKAASELHAERRNAVGAAGADAANAELARWTSMSDPQQREAMGRAIMAVIAVTEGGLRDTATVSAELICGHDRSLDVGRVRAILSELSATVGSLDPASYRGLFEPNPLRDRPFLEHEGEYLLALAGAMTRDVDTLLESRVLKGRPGFSKQRAKTLDRLAVGYLGRLLPGAATYTNLHYEGTELDGLVLFERTALAVEGKGTGISVQGQRGDVDRLSRDIAAAVDDAWRQGSRARAFLLRAGDSVFTDKRGAELLRIQSGQVRDVIIVNPTLHELAGFAQQLPRLRALGLFKAGEYPWSIFINDLRVIAETCENPAVFLHYLVWRNRLPLGDRLTVTDEIDLWASYLLCERFTGLSRGGRMIIGNASTDFDAYYDGLAGRGPKREPPTKFLPESVRAFVSRLASTQPPGWREATGVCLDLSIPELAFVDANLREVASEAATAGPVSLVAGRVLLLGLTRRVNASEGLMLYNAGEGDPTFAIACRLGNAGEPEIAWAQYRKPFTFELSDFEERAFLFVAGSGSRAGRRRTAVGGVRRGNPSSEVSVRATRALHSPGLDIRQLVRVGPTTSSPCRAPRSRACAPMANGLSAARSLELASAFWTVLLDRRPPRYDPVTQITIHDRGGHPGS
jgi:hypothetical protein